MSKLSENVVLFSQGAYGCIFMDDVTLSNKNEKPVYIKKVQKRKETSDNEIMIGKNIKKIKNYRNYYAPIEESSQLELSSNDSNEIKKCEFITSEKKEFETNKIRFVGEHTLANYLNLLSKYEKNASTFFQVFLDSFTHLCEGINKLSEGNIVHMDLKENNIVYDEKKRQPIIIDFGLSKDVLKSDPKSTFFVYGPDYSPWCFDICLLTFLCNEVGEDWEKKVIESIHLEKVVNDFLNENTGVKDLLNNEQKELLKRNLYEEMGDYVNFEGKKVYDMVLKKYKSWDNYSLAVIFLYILKLMSNEIINNDEIIKKLKFILLDIMINNKNRNTSQETLKKMYNEFSSKNKKSIQELGNKFKVEFTPEKFNARTILLAETKIKVDENKKN